MAPEIKNEDPDMDTCAFTAFCKRWPGTSEDEFKTYVEHTSVILDKPSILAHLDWKNAFDLAAFVFQVDYLPDGSCDLAARDQITLAAEAAGFKNVDSSMSRAAFQFVPGSWQRFQHVVEGAAHRSGVALKRVLLCSASLGLCFRFPEDPPTEPNQPVQERFVEYMINKGAPFMS